ncbi:MAG: hypothetical protein KJO54_08535 [Gammaproteobacteria bacterium]|nr:hypothetical protein [Gammaproteobacteria bacterium]NNF61662.1 hypothetical protein [Gammaproteobacteria bacterium]
MTSDSNKDSLAERMARMLVRPIVGILLRSGLPFSRFAEICRSVYVEVAANEFGLDGRRTNNSRIALLTGLSRTRVKQELDQLASGPEDANTQPIDQVRPASRILMAWHTDPDFLDASGQPLQLPLEKGSPSFKDLYEKYSGKVVPITAMLKELRNVGAVTTTRHGMLRVLVRSYTPQQSDPGATKRVCMAVRDLAETGSWNLYRDEDQRARFERFATNQLVPVSAVKDFTDFLNEEGQAFLERADNWLIEKETSDPTEDVARMGVGVYQIAPFKTPGSGNKK